MVLRSTFLKYPSFESACYLLTLQKYLYAWSFLLLEGVKSNRMLHNVLYEVKNKPDKDPHS